MFNDVGHRRLPRRAEAGRLLQGVDAASTARRPGTCWKRASAPSRDRAAAAVAYAAARPRSAAERCAGAVVEVAAAALVLAEIVILLLGVVARFGFNRPIVWTDELA